MQRPHAVFFVAGAVVCGTSAAVLAQRDFSKVEIRAEKVADRVAMLKGAGGNIGVCTGPDGVFMIDDQYAPLSEKIRAAIAQIDDGPIRFVLNTHWHGDHTGGNAEFSTHGALTVAHENVRRRMSSELYNAAFDTKTAPSPTDALPVITFSDTVTFHWNGNEIRAIHMPRAHTDGDAIVFFDKADVVHMGDCFFNGMYPFIDVASGGSVDGMIAASEHVLARITHTTRIIPGHGPLADRAALVAYHEMLVAVRAKVRELAAGGKSLVEVRAAKPTAAFDATWGKGFISPDKFVDFVYGGVKDAPR